MTISLHPMDQYQMKYWLERTLADYVSDRVQSGESEEIATAKAMASNVELFPQGIPSPGHLIYDVLQDGQAVDFLWIGPEEPARSGAWWVWDISINQDHRGQGYGRATMLLAEEEVRGRGGSEIGLHVFGFNTPAQGLYRSLGYHPTSIRMTKTLG